MPPASRRRSRRADAGKQCPPPLFACPLSQGDRRRSPASARCMREWVPLSPRRTPPVCGAITGSRRLDFSPHASRLLQQRTAFRDAERETAVLRGAAHRLIAGLADEALDLLDRHGERAAGRGDNVLL